MRRLIGLVGVARAGKDTIAEELALFDFCRLAFADPLKRAASVLFQVPMDFLTTGDREVPHPFWGISARQMLQDFGTQSVRNVFGEDFWLRCMELSLSRVPPWQNVVVPDVRFDNEVEFIRRQGGVVWGVVRPGAPAVRLHVSEEMAANRLHEVCDLVLQNDGSLDEFRERVRSAAVSS